MIELFDDFRDILVELHNAGARFVVPRMSCSVLANNFDLFQLVIIVNIRSLKVGALIAGEAGLL